MKHKELNPNSNPKPSAPTNDPYAMASLLAGAGDNLSPGAGQLDLSTVTEMAGIHQFGMPEIVPQGPNNDLAHLRSRFPFVPIIPIMGQYASVFLPISGVADELELPPGTTAIMFSASNDYYISLQGNAELPTAANIPARKTGNPITFRSFYKPSNGILWYCGNIKHISCIAPNNNTFVGAMCYITNDWPTRERIR